MGNAPKTFRGVVHGNAIELEGNANLPEGQQVRVTVQAAGGDVVMPGDGLRHSAGGWDDDPRGLEDYLKWNSEQRKQRRPELEP